MIHGEGGGGDVCVGCVNRGGGAFISGEHGSKGHILRGTWKQRHYLGTGTQENKFSILGEQGNKPIHFRGTCTPPPPLRGYRLPMDNSAQEQGHV